MTYKSIKNNIGRPKTFNKDNVVKLAMYHFWEYGYDNTSLDDLLLAMGIKKSSFYRTFKSKEEIFSLSLHLYREETFKLLTNLKNEIGVKQTLIFLIKDTIEQLTVNGKVKGCLLMNSGKECYLKYPNLSNQIHIELEEFTNFITKFINEAQKNNEITNKMDSDKLAIRFLTLYNGIAMMLQAKSDIKTIDDLLIFVEELLA